MSTEPLTLSISGLEVAVVRKDIKNLHLGVYPPDGRVRVAVPLAVSDAAVRVAVIGKLRWIRQQRAAFAAQARQSEREMVGGESHYVFGERRRLSVVETAGRPAVRLRGRGTLEIAVRASSSPDERAELLQRWYRERLREQAAPLVAQWQTTLGVSVSAWGIKRMKTMWGACNPDTRRIWLNLELAKKPLECLEFVVVHELVHLLSRHHDERFHALMDEHLPSWRSARGTLNAGPLAAEAWDL